MDSLSLGGMIYGHMHTHQYLESSFSVQILCVKHDAIEDHFAW